MNKIISGIQQMGIGVPNVHDGFKVYNDLFGFSTPLFDDNGTAELMLPYTNNQPQNRHAILSLNLRGGGGLEIWQYTTRTPLGPDFKVELGDLGIYICKIKCDDIKATYNELKNNKADILSEPSATPHGLSHFFVRDNYGNLFEIVENILFFNKGKRHTGGVAGAGIGVSDIEASINFYRDVLGYDKIIYDTTGRFDDLAALDGGDKEFRRVLLTHSLPRRGSFSRLLGETQIELFQAINSEPRKIFRNRQWGDLGFIHLCFDVKHMTSIKQECAELGYPFTVDSGDSSFDMGEAAGHFAYVEDPDGTLIELVETFKIPVLKKIGWYLHLDKRDPEKALPDWILRLLKYV